MLQSDPMKRPRPRPSAKTAHASASKPLAPKAKGPSPIPKKDPDAFPMRINKYLAMKGFSTRRGADELVQKKAVTINGRIAALGDKVSESDAVEVRSRKAERHVYYAYNKPRGISTDDTAKGAPSIRTTSNLKGVFPVGSLDVNAQGLVIMTNDRRIIDRLQNPARPHVRIYTVKSLTPLRTNFKEKMEAGVILANGTPARAEVSVTSPTSFTATVRSVANPLREMCSMFGAEIESLTRTRILNISLGRLPFNSYRTIEGDELKTFLAGLGL